MSTRRDLFVLSAAALAVTFVTPAYAGPLDPPAGPIASTPGPEPRIPINAVNTPGDADSTFRITQPGSYYLTGNITALAGRHGIEIASSNVTLDLMGFSIAGAGGGAGIDGIHAELPAQAQRSTIVNGVIRNFPGDGIGCEQFGAMLVDRIKVADCGGNGVSVNSGTVITQCIVGACGGAGFLTSNGVSVFNSVAGGCGGHGFQVGTSSIIKDCLASGNTGAGFTTSSVNGFNIADSTADANRGAGIVGPTQSLVVNCQVRNNADLSAAGGIVVGAGSNIIGCVVNLNTGPGINCGNASTVRQCLTQSNSGIGIVGGAGVGVLGCSAIANTLDGILLAANAHVVDCSVLSNLRNGIVVSSQFRVSGCNATGNSIHGIQATAFAGVVEHCTTVSNSSDGIHVLEDAYVLNCLSDQSGGAAISVGGPDCRIQGNSCTDSNIGIQVVGAGAFIVANTCSGNGSNYEIAANNVVGAIIQGTLSGAISGSTGGLGTGSSNPWSNFSF